MTACATAAREGTERSDQPCGGTSTDILAPTSRSHRGAMPPSSANSRHARPPARAGGDPERMLRRWASGDHKRDRPRRDRDRRVREQRSCYRVGRDGNGGDGGGVRGVSLRDCRNVTSEVCSFFFFFCKREGRCEGWEVAGGRSKSRS